MDLASLIRQIEALPAAQKQVILDALRDDLGEGTESFEIPEFHRQVIGDRVRERDADPARGEPWDVVRRRLGWGP